MAKNWIGNKNSIFTPHGASNHSDTDRESDDYYATHPSATEALLETGEVFNDRIYEPACGEGHIAGVLKEHEYKVKCSDIIDRGYPRTRIVNFLELEIEKETDCDIITNPPYKYAKEFVEKSLQFVKMGNKVAMLLKLTFLEGQGRKPMFLKNPPKYVYVFSARTLCAKNGEFMTNCVNKDGEPIKNKDGTIKQKKLSNAVAYAWFVWEKGFKGEPIIRWI